MNSNQIYQDRKDSKKMVKSCKIKNIIKILEHNGNLNKNTLTFVFISQHYNNYRRKSSCRCNTKTQQSRKQSFQFNPPTKTSQFTYKQLHNLYVKVISNNNKMKKNIADLYGAAYGDNGMFKGEIKIVQEKQIIPNKELQFAEILIKKNYFSRRDQYKVTELLKDRITHVYNRKIFYFQNTKIEVTNMLKTNQQVLKTGFITKNTKLIFRSGCSKTAILVQLSKQAFQLNSTRELYLQRMIQFLIIYFNRNNYFNNKHRIQIILYARLFYPQFKTLTQAYNRLMKQATLQSSQNKFQVNYAVTLQKDYKGRIYQDAYRKIIWDASSLANFKKYFLQKVSQFMFTINWDFNKSKQSQFIAKSINDKVKNQFQCVQIPEAWKIKPFIHRMRCELAASYDSNLFQAICLVSEQYKHHYKFRALDQTGNAIIILSAGRSEYQTDRTTYNMAKSYIYLTNISCMMVNLNKKVDKIKVHVYDIPRFMFKQQSDINKLQKLVHWCIQEFVYQSPINQRIRFTSHKTGFQMKSFIYPHDIVPISQKSMQSKFQCYIKHKQGQKTDHYQLNQEYMEQFSMKTKQLEWINSYFVNNEALKIHQKFYEKAKFETNFYQSFNKEAILKCKYRNSNQHSLNYALINQLDIFEQDLQKIIIKKQSWLNIGPFKNQLNHKFDKYLKQYINVKRLNDQQSRNQLTQIIEITNRRMFDIQSRKVQKTPRIQFDNRSNDDNLQSVTQEPLQQIRRLRKQSQYIYSGQQAVIQQAVQHIKPKVNIFEQTLRNKQYSITTINKQKSKKSLSHNRQRLRANYKQSNIHYMMTYYNQINVKRLLKFIRKEFYQTLSQEQLQINQAFQYQKQWKNLCFPILTPIYTKYKEDFKQVQIILDSTQTGDDRVFENDCCKLLMENYQLAQVKANRTIFKFSKGNIIKTLQKNGNNITKTITIDKQNQINLIPFLLYRYLLYQQKDYRFCSKTIYFQDKNYYDKQKKDNIQSETKSLKLLFLFDSNSDDGKESMISAGNSTGNPNNFKKSSIDQFKRLFKEKFHKEIHVTQIKVQEPQKKPQINSKKEQISIKKVQVSIKKVQISIKKQQSFLKKELINSIDLSDRKSEIKESPIKSIKLGSSKQKLDTKKSVYIPSEKQWIPSNGIKEVGELQFFLDESNLKKHLSQQIKMKYDKQFSSKNLFKITIQWDHCSSILVSQFVENLITIGRRSKLNSFMTTTEDVFNIQWNMNVVGEIVFSNILAVEIMQNYVAANDSWYFDHMGFYMDAKGIYSNYLGIAFIKFEKEKKLILWKDNNYEKKNINPQIYTEQYNNFFMLAAAFDFLGEMIQKAIKIYQNQYESKDNKISQNLLSIISFDQQCSSANGSLGSLNSSQLLRQPIKKDI